MVDDWEVEGLVRVWDGSVGDLKRGQFTPLPGEQRKYVGADGMMGLADRLGEKVGRFHQSIHKSASFFFAFQVPPLALLLPPLWYRHQCPFP